MPIATARTRFGKIIVCLAVGLVAAACGGTTRAEPRPGASTAAHARVVVPPRADGQIYLFAPWDQELTAYDPRTGAVVSASKGRDLYYYGFPTASTLYTVGDTNKLGFSVVDVRPTAVRTVARAKADEAIFPLATDGSRSFFVIYTYDGSGVELGRRIVRLLDDGTFTTYATFAGPKQMVDKGVIIGHTLYYSVYNSEKDEHTVFSIPADRPGSDPAVVRRGLASGELYGLAGKLLVSDGTTIMGADHHYPCATLCWFYQDPAVLVRLTAQDTELVLSVIDTADGKVIASVPKAIGFDLEGRKLSAYTDEGVRVVKLAGHAA